MQPHAIERINELAKKAKTPAGLTAEERTERDALRREYVEAVRRNMKAQLDALRGANGPQ